jgi:hypothetical protein
MEEKFELITADFAYVRWLGDRKGIEKQTTTWDKSVVDRRQDLSKWVELFRMFVGRNLNIFAYANNHYALCRHRHKAYNAAFRIMPN